MKIFFGTKITILISRKKILVVKIRFYLKMFDLKEQMNKRLNDRAKLLGIGGEFGVVPPDTSHLNNDDFGAFIRGEISVDGKKIKTPLKNS